ncbi:NnrS family protein [Nitrosococcus halophilus Nc 4]|uniref:NnrS family protein n=1 Tax=Nitrosococcus halophilus (strain Nc4) TaxID=472759 RepID=D5C361_NITHN|nr:NnrS family protein [Nitrosococcus halophilus]ADE14953.1 NnrS family protein [Nitrosococcus halophilus Nc 4]ADE14969.1 NnrS family protein [Nitrosococcus halophilus Nc 4]
MSSSTPMTNTAFRRPRWTFLGTGFRPFFWLGALMSGLWMLLWLLLLKGQWYLNGYFPLPYWHAHEMLFGFVSAIIAGFLLTAAQNWTGRPTATGPSLLLLVLLWLAGRTVMLLGNTLPPLIVITVDMAFIPCLMFFIARPIIATGNTRSLPLIGILGILASCNLLVHLGGAGYFPTVIAPALQATVNVITLLMVIIGGRVIPFFTRNALPQTPIRQFPWLDRLAIGSVAAILIIEAITGVSPLMGVIALTAGGLNLARLLGWGGYKTLSRPLLWVLHLGYLWICAGLMTKGLDAYLPGDYRSIAIHLLTVGAMGTLILGMMSRVALGHTGRRLELPQGMIWAYVLLTLGAIVRIGGPLLLPAHMMVVLLLSGGLWIAAFGLFVFRYTTILWRPRVDGRPG